MTKLVFDADGLIKLTKAGILKEVLECFDCFISDEVFEEVVVEGKRFAFEDAFVVDEFIEVEKLIVRGVRTVRSVGELIDGEKGLGKGEISALHLFYDIKATAIVSDDQNFLAFLDRAEVPFIIPADLICRLYKLKKLTHEVAVSALNKIKPFIRDRVFDNIIKKIEGGKK